MGSKFATEESFWTQKSWWNFSLKSIQKPKWVKKVAPGFLKASFTFIFPIFIIFEVGRNFYGSGRLFENLSCGAKNFQKSHIFKKVKNHHFSTFVVFFLSFWAKWPKLPTFAQFCLSEISRVLGGTPWKLGFWLQMHWLQLKQLSRNFCRGSKISAKIKTLKSALKHISVP